MPVTHIKAANAAFEKWLRAELKGDVVEADLRTKSGKMSAAPFPFLRSTYWRWAETILEVCPKLRDAPQVLAVGDIHLENFGTWRDVDGRLIWGVNDFDEAAVMPYALDLVRLGVSAMLGCPGADVETISARILKGYRRGIENPHAIVLDHDYAWLRDLVVVPNADRVHFWAKISALKTSRNPPPAFAKVLYAAMPEPKPKLRFHRRTAGAGSLGRPRWVGIGEWHGAPIMREAKAVLPSAWLRSHGAKAQAHRCYEIATARYRAPDPWYGLTDSIVVRRLSPNNRKIEAEGEPDELIGRKMLRAMGHELASVHLGSDNARTAIERDLDRRKRTWLASSIEAAADFVRRDFKEWKKKG
jgi:hypothetical protein